MVGGNADATWLPDGRFWYVRTTNYVMRRRWDYFVKYLLDAEPPNSYVIPSVPGKRGGGTGAGQ